MKSTTATGMPSDELDRFNSLSEGEKNPLLYDLAGFMDRSQYPELYVRNMVATSETLTAATPIIPYSPRILGVR